MTAFLEESEPRLSQCHEFREDLDQQHLFSGGATGLVVHNNFALLAVLLVLARVWIF